MNEQETFKNSYEKLEEINVRLQTSSNDSALIDDLAPMLESASRHFQICKERIEASEKLLAKFEKEFNLSSEN